MTTTHITTRVARTEDTLSPDIQPGLLLRKPWGLENLLFHSSSCELWELQFLPGTQTSFHLHERKQTVLVVVAGRGILRHGTKEQTLSPGDWATIPAQTPHQLHAQGHTGLLVCELETPPDKNDIIRLDDAYGRRHRPFLFGSTIAAAPPQTQLLFRDPDELTSDRVFEERLALFVRQPHIATDLGLARELYTPRDVGSALKIGVGSLAGVLEVFVPAVHRQPTSPGEFGTLLKSLDREAHLRSNGLLGRDSRNIHGNVWREFFIMLSGSMDLVEFEPTEAACRSMRRTEGALFVSLSDITARQYAASNIRCTRLRPGDVYYSPPGTAHGQLHCRDAVYVVFISRSPDFWHQAERFWGKDSRKWRINEELGRTHSASGGASYWGIYANRRKNGDAAATHL